jgi:hypothetical protein
MKESYNYTQLTNSTNNFITGLVRARSHKDNFTPVELQLDNNIFVTLNRLPESSLPLTPDNLNWLMQQIGATPDAVTAGFVTGRIIATEQINTKIEKVDNSSSLADKYQIPIAVPSPFDRSNEDIYNFKLGFIAAQSDWKSFSTNQREIDRDMSAIINRLGKISIPFNLENLTWMIQQLGVTTPNAVFAGFVAGRMYTYEQTNNALDRADSLLSGISQKYGI